MAKHVLLTLGLALWTAACTGDDATDGAGTETETEGTGSSGTPMTTMSMTTATPGDGTSTGEPPADSTDGDTTAAPGDSTGSDSGSGDTGSTGTGDTSTGGGEAVYMQCDLAGDPVCPEPWGECYAFIRGYTVCTLPCGEAGDCPAPPDGDAVPVCGGQDQDQCLLDCQNDETCPTGMECQSFSVPQNDFFRCVWPD
ncbi:MAG: hypothetical protein AAF721_38900 [Myxococcota bacterium]